MLGRFAQYFIVLARDYWIKIVFFPGIKTKLFIAAAIAALTFCIGAAFAQQRELKTETSGKLDVILLLDASGSMLLTDPQRLRDQGARLLVESLKPGDRLGIVEFSTDAKIVRALTDYRPEEAAEVSQRIGRIENSGIFTDILSGINLARSLIEEGARDEADRVIVLLSDGKMDPDPVKGTAEVLTRDLLDNILPGLRSGDIRVYTLYFSDQADKDLLSEIALGTNGLNWFTPNPDKIHESFQSLFLSVKKPQIVPLTSRGFPIDPEVQEATFYVNREGDKEVSVISPSGQRISSALHGSEVRWFSSPRFEVITIGRPEPGHWLIEGVSQQEGFATVLTNLKLVSDWVTSMYAGSPALLQARLYDNDKPVILPEMTGAAQYAFQIVSTDRVAEPLVRDFLKDDGKSGDKIAKDGIFSSTVSIDEPGEYKLTILVKHPTFERTQQIPFRVKPPFVAVSTVEKEERLHFDQQMGESAVKELGEEASPLGGRKVVYFQVVLNPDASNVNRLAVKLIATDAQRRRFELPLARQPGKDPVYTVPVKRLPEAGEFQVQAFASGESKKGRIQEESKILQYHFEPEAGHSEEVEVVKLREPEPVKAPFRLPWWVYNLVVWAAIIPYGLFSMKQMQRSQTNITVSMPSFDPSPEVQKALQALRDKAALKEVDLEAPMFTDPNFKPLLPKKGKEESASEESPAAAVESQAGKVTEDAAAAAVEASQSGGDEPAQAAAEKSPEEAQPAAEGEEEK